MNHPIRLKTTTPPLLITLTLLCFGLLPGAQAVVPPPDGGYPGFNTAEGQKALFFLTTGTGNTALGWRSLFSNTDASFSTGVGAGALVLNNGSSNTAVGTVALLLNTTGGENVAVGTDSLVNNDSGSSNNAVGAFALFNNIDGLSNNAFGDSALFANIHANNNTAIGDFALSNNDNTGLGLGSYNTAVGASALFFNTDGTSDTAVGSGALSSNTTGNGNTADGLNAIPNNTTGNFNTAIGAGALIDNNGDSNTALGYLAGRNVTTANNVICIGIDGNNVSNSCYIGQIFDATSANGVAVLINSNGRLGTMTSSARFKEDINPMNHASDALYALKPITFRYKKQVDPEGTSAMQFGLVAEDVERVNPDLVVRDKEGKPYSVRYEQVNAMLLNEFLKEHRKVEELEANAVHLQKQVEALTAGLEKVSAQLKASTVTPQIASNQ